MTTFFKKAEILAIFFISFLINSCTEADDKRANQIIYNGTEYEIPAGRISFEDFEGGVRNSTILLYSDTYALNYENDLTGVGHKFYFEELFHTSTNAAGKYSLEFNSSSHSTPEIMYEIYLVINKSGGEKEVYEFHTGQANISVSNNIYTISFDGKDKEGKKVSLYYKGILATRG